MSEFPFHYLSICFIISLFHTVIPERCRDTDFPGLVCDTRQPSSEGFLSHLPLLSF